LSIQEYIKKCTVISKGAKRESSIPLDNRGISLLGYLKGLKGYERGHDLE